MMKKILTIFILNFSITGSVLGTCDDNKFSAEDLEKQWKAKIVETIGNYGKFSSYTLESISSEGSRRFAKMIRLKRECKAFEFEVSKDATCIPQVSLVSLQSCLRSE